MNRRVFSLLIFFVVGMAALGWLAYATQPAQASDWTKKVDPWVLETAAAESTTEFLVFLKEQADVSGAEALETKLAKGTYVFEQLTAVAEATQPPVIAALEAAGVPYQSFWVANMIWVRGDVGVVQAMAQREDVAHIYANPTVHMEPLPPVDPQVLIEAAQTVEWNITHVGAPDVWAEGITGQGAVIGGQDTGYDWDHPALINQYRGWDGGTADHNYNWHDSIHVPNGFCQADSPEPCDDHNHGTHTMGTMVGDDGGANQIGMAPGARWIGCRNMNQGNGTPTTYSECYQWFIAPTDLNNQNPDPAMAPHVINNSWSCPPSEGCTDPNILLTVVQNVRAAGIVTVHSAGNGGSSCSTVSDPAGIYAESFSVGATSSTDTIAGFSSRGPVTVDGSNRRKPDISAPGVSIRSSVRNGGYQSGWSGTSMAAPHVAGLVGLVVSAQPGLAGDVDTLEMAIEQTALPRTTSQGCGGDGPTDVPNNVYGWGRIDAYSAYQLAITHDFEVSKTTPVSWVAPGNLLTYTINITHVQLVSPTSNVILTDTIPTGTTFFTTTTPYTMVGDTIQWQISSMAANENLSVQLVVQVDSTVGDVVNEAYGVRSDEVTEAVLGTAVTTPIVPYELGVAKTAAGAVSAGGNLTYTLAVTNLHPFAAVTNVTLTDTIPANTTFVTATMPHIFDGTTVWWDAASVSASGSWMVELVVQAPFTESGWIVNDTYGVWSSEVPELVTGEPVTTAILSYALTMSKTVNVTDTAPGGTLTYTLRAKNPHAETSLTNLVFTDTVPTNTTFITATMPHTFDGTVVQWDAATLAAGENWLVTLVVQVPVSATAGLVENADYGLTSDQVTGLSGPAVTTTITVMETPMFYLYLPFIRN